MHSISLDGYCMSCTRVQTFIEKKKKKKTVGQYSGLEETLSSGFV